ncbi:MAG: ABC transporter permease subunit [Fuerstiella sp.]
MTSQASKETDSAFQSVLGPVVVALFLLLAWHVLVSAFQVPKIVVPLPLDVAIAVRNEWWVLVSAMFQTSVAAMTGLLCSLVLGVFVACVFAQSGLIRISLYPYAILLQTVPVIAIAPIVIAAVGRGFAGVVLISLIISLFPVITNTTTGLLRVDKGLLELFQLHSASRWQTLVKLRLPNSVPYIVAGVRIAAGASVVGAIVGEFFVGSSLSGLGVLIERRNNGFATDRLYAAVFASAILGVIVFVAVSRVGDWFLKRYTGNSD